MADVTIITPPSQVQSVNAVGQQAQSSADAKASAINVPPGNVIAGTIIGKDPNGNFLLRSNQGTIALKSDTPLTYNSDVVIRVGTSSAGSTTARIVSVNGEPFAEFSAATSLSSDDSVSPSLLAASQSSNAAAETEPGNTPTTTVTGTVVSSPDTNVNTTLANGTNVVIRVPNAPPAASAPPAATEEPAASNSPANTTPASSPEPQNTPQAQVQAQTPLPAQTAVQSQNIATPATPASNAVPPSSSSMAQVHTVNTTPSVLPEEQTVVAAPQSSAVNNNLSSNPQYAAYTKNVPASPAPPSSPVPSSPPASATPATPTTAAPTTPVQGQVTSNSQGLVVVQTPQGTVTVKTDALPASTLLTPGTNVSLETPASPVIQSASIIAQALLSSEPASITELATSWQTLTDIIDTVNAVNPSAASALQENLPQLGPEFIPSTTAFVAAVAQGDIRKLLGDDVIDTLKQNGRSDLLDRFSGELRSMTESLTPATEHQTPGWQMLFLPFVFQEEIQQARLYVKRDAPKKEQNKGKATGDTRFVVEMDFSELGPMQMDGLVRTKEQSTAFDLIVRSANPFTREQVSDIAAIYKNAAELTGFKGSVTFQVTKDFPIKPLDGILANKPHSIIV